MKQILTILRLDLTNATRDSIALYVLVGPILLAVILRLVIPSVEGTRLRFVLLDTAGDGAIERTLAGYGSVQHERTLEGLEARVRRADDVAGVVAGAQGVELVVEGNEDAGLVATWQAVTSALRSQPARMVVFESLGSERSKVREYALIFLLISIPLLAAMIAGFSFVEDHESEVARALAASPLTLRTYLGARAVMVTVVGSLLSAVAALIFGARGLPAFRLGLVLLASGPVAAVFGYIVALVARTQIAALGSVKLLLPLYTLPALLGVFIPEGWHWPLYVFPNYWVFAALRSLVMEGPFLVPFWVCLAALVATGLAACVGVGSTLRRRFALR